MVRLWPVPSHLLRAELWAWHSQLQSAPTASHGFQLSPRPWPVTQPPFLSYALLLAWALCYSRTNWFVSGGACIIPPLYVFIHKVPAQLDSTTQPPLWELFPLHLLPGARSNIYFLSTTVTHLFRYIYLRLYQEPHCIHLFSVGRQRHRYNNKYICFQSSTSLLTEPVSLNELLQIHNRRSGEHSRAGMQTHRDTPPPSSPREFTPPGAQNFGAMVLPAVTENQNV